MTKFKMLIVAAVGVAMAGSAAVTGASAETTFQAHHPRRVEVNHRLSVENLRIHKERREGLIGPRKAARLHAQVREIRKHERIDARFDRSHLTRHEDRALNHQENRVDRELSR
jgi:hypothetical protein